MIAYFKVGQKGTTWFNFCTSVDVDEAARDQVNSLHAHPKYKGARLSATIGSPNTSLARHHSNGTVASPHHNGDRTTPRAVQPSVAALSNAEGDAIDDGQTAERASNECSLCGEFGAEKGCTYSTLMRAMCNWKNRWELRRDDILAMKRMRRSHEHYDLTSFLISSLSYPLFSSTLLCFDLPRDRFTDI